MNNTSTINAAPQTSSFKMLRAMVGIGIMCALFIVLTYEFTLPVIAQNKAEGLDKAILKVLPGAVSKAIFKLDENKNFIQIEDANGVEEVIFAGYDQNQHLVGLAIEASGQGYADIIRILYGYDPEKQEIIGFYVLESKETPGLGDKIEKDPNFLSNFQGLDVSLNANLSALVNKPITVKSGEKDKPWQIDGITGATISSRAIGEMIGNSTAYWMPLIYKNKEALVKSKGAHE